MKKIDTKKERFKNLFNIDKSQYNKEIVKKRTLILGSIFATMLFFASADILGNLLTSSCDFNWFSIIVSLFVFYITYKSFRWMKKEFMFLTYNIKESKHGHSTSSLYMRLDK